MHWSTPYPENAGHERKISAVLDCHFGHDMRGLRQYYEDASVKERRPLTVLSRGFALANILNRRGTGTGLPLWYSPGIGVRVFQPSLYVAVKWVHCTTPPPPAHESYILRILLCVVAFHLGLMYLCLHFLILLCIGTWIVCKRRVCHMLPRHCNQNRPLSSLKIVSRTKSKSYESVLLRSWYCRILILGALDMRC